MIGFSLINGLVFGIEHVSPDEDDVFDYLIEINLLFIRIAFVKLKDGFIVEE